MKNTRKKGYAKGGNNNYTVRRSQLGGKNKKAKNKSRKMKGGQQVYGRGYGANCYDPSFSIYNTNELKLFPYKPQ